MKIKPISAFCLVLCIFATFSTAFGEEKDYTYITNSGAITITRFTGPDSAVAIPNRLSGLLVTGIGSNAFASCTNLTSVFIPDTVINIQDGAFRDCTGLADVSIGKCVTNIGVSAFWKCTRLTGITIPGSVANIGACAFFGCSNLLAIAVDESNPVYSSLEGVLFNKDRSTLLQCPGGIAGDYAVPDRVAVIGYMAFTGCSSLVGVTMPDNVISVGERAFLYCRNLATVTISPCVTSIGEQAFLYCSSLTNVTIPDGCTNIGNWAFGECTSLTNVTIGKSVTTIGAQSFFNCLGLTSITIPGSVNTIGDSAFYWCPNLIEVYFQGNAPRIESSEFSCSFATIYFLPGTLGWGSSCGGRPTAPWVLPCPVILATSPGFGARGNEFGFRISWALYSSVVVEASTTLVNPVWSSVSTNTLMDGWCYFGDANWTNYPARFYRVRSF